MTNGLAHQSIKVKENMMTIIQLDEAVEAFLKTCLTDDSDFFWLQCVHINIKMFMQHEGQSLGTQLIDLPKSTLLVVSVESEQSGNWQNRALLDAEFLNATLIMAVLENLNLRTQ